MFYSMDLENIRTSAESIALKKKQELPLPPDPSKIDYYKNFDELWKLS